MWNEYSNNRGHRLHRKCPVQSTGVPITHFSSRQFWVKMGDMELIPERALPTPESKDLGFEICERGILVKPGDAESFARGLQYVLEHPDVCREIGQRGREYALKHHSKERLVADMDRLYRSLLE